MSNIVYFIQRESDGMIKIGLTSQLSVRMYKLRAHHGDISVLGVVDGGYLNERRLHEEFSEDNLHGEWFHPSERLLLYIDENTREPQDDKIQITAVIRRDLCAWLDNEAGKTNMSRAKFIEMLLKEHRKEKENGNRQPQPA